MSSLARQTRIDLCFNAMLSQASVNDATVETLRSFNAMVNKAKRYCEIELVFAPIDLGKVDMLAVGDSAFNNVLHTKTAAGYIIGLMATDDVEKGEGTFSVLSFRSHLLNRSSC